jgi:hypothetical protein
MGILGYVGPRGETDGTNRAKNRDGGSAKGGMGRVGAGQGGAAAGDVLRDGGSIAALTLPYTCRRDGGSIAALTHPTFAWPKLAVWPLAAAFDHGEDFVLADDEEVFVVDGDLGAGVAMEEDPIAVVNTEADASSVGQPPAVADREDAALSGFLSGLFGQDDPAGGCFFRLQTADDDFVTQGHQFHPIVLRLEKRPGVVVLPRARSFDCRIRHDP